MRKTVVLFAALVAMVISLLPAGAFAQEERADWLDIEVGKSIVLETPRVPKAIAITDPKVVNFQPLGEATRIQIQGLAIGTTDLIVQFGAGIAPMIYEITVHRDLSDLIRRIDAIVEGEPPRVYPLGNRIVLEGPVDDLDTLEQVALIAEIYDEDFVNLMAVRGDHQVQLEVLFAEVSRTATRELGINLLFADGGNQIALTGPITNQFNQVLHPGADAINGGVLDAPGSGTFSIAGFSSDLNIAGIISLLDNYDVGKILAQPILVSLSGQQSEFLAGGELPIPSPQGQGAIAIQYKEYGIKLAFVPTVLAGEVIDVIMDVEVSEPDYSVATRITGIEVPGFITRRGTTHLRIESGMTFAVAGLLSEDVAYSRVGVPGLGRIPIIGTLFRTTRHVRSETEVVIYVTPRLVRPLAPGEVPAAPGSTENNNPSDFELFLLGMGHRPGSRTAEPTGAVGLQR